MVTLQPIMPWLLSVALLLNVASTVFGIHDDPDKPETLRRRYWGDDVQPCIEKYCMEFVNSGRYWKCLSDYCPAGLLIIPREIGVEMESSEEDFDDAGSEWLSVCPAAGPKGFDAAKSCTTRSCVAVAMLQQSRHEALSASALQLCARFNCRGTEAEQAEQCVRQKCCPGNPVPELTSQSMATERQLLRKRRVNDEVSQCIQSYCSGKNSASYRLMCIVNKCNRG